MNNATTPDGKRLKIMGIVLIALGVIALFAPALAAGTVVIVVGLTLLVAGIAQIVQGLRADSWRDKALPLILGIVTGIAGIGVLGHPLLGLGFLTLLLVIFFVTEGVWKIIASFQYRPASGWVWMLAGGAFSLLLGLLIWNQWPVSGVVAVGVLVGIDLVSTGVSLVLLAATLKELAARGGRGASV